MSGNSLCSEIQLSGKVNKWSELLEAVSKASQRSGDGSLHHATRRSTLWKAVVEFRLSKRIQAAGNYVALEAAMVL